MNIQLAPIRYCAVAMELVAYLDDHFVEMNILTDAGKRISIACKADSILSIQRNIAKLDVACPEIATWKEPHNS